MSAAVIGRVLVRRRPGIDADPSGAVARRLAGLDLAPAGVAPSAVLCIRRLADPLPGTLRLDGPADASGGAWSSAVAWSVERMARAAARPADGPVPAGADAVLFRDRVELLACLAEAVVRPGAAGAWWWHGLGVGRGGVADAWLREVRLLPGVVDLLERRGTLPVLRRLHDADLARLASAIAADAGLPALARAVGAPPAAAPGAGQAARAGSPTPAEAAAGVARLEQQTRALGDLAPLDGPALGLAVVALTIHRRPALARDPVLPAVIARLAARRGGTPRNASDGDVASPAGQAPPHHQPSTPAPATRPAPAVRRGRPASARRPPAVRGARVVRATRDAGVLALARREARLGALPAPDAGAPIDRGADDVVETALGGTWSLLVLALDLGLYGDFTRPLAPGLRLDPWDLVAMLATELGARDARPDDALWPLLARLSGRSPAARPGAGWRPPVSWRVPAEWLRAVPSARTWTWSAADGRLRVEHPAGFAVLDGPLAAHAPGDVRRHLRQSAPIGVPRLRRGEARPPVRARAADRWVAELARYARARLGPRLGVRDDAGLRRVLLERTARVHIGPGTVDVVLALDALPIAVRAAGLDRDPGPVPAARRSIRFHYR